MGAFLAMSYLRIMCFLAVTGGCGNAPSIAVDLGQLWSAFPAGNGQDSAPVDIVSLRAALTPGVIAQFKEPVIILQVPQRASFAAVARVASNAEVDTFLTTDGLSLSTQDGIVVATRGFGFDLMIADISRMRAALTGDVSHGGRLHTYLDGQNHTVQLQFVCNYQWAGPFRVLEKCKSDLHGFENTYDLDPDGRITASQQWISPEIGSVLIERLN